MYLRFYIEGQSEPTQIYVEENSNVSIRAMMGEVTAIEIESIHEVNDNSHCLEDLEKQLRLLPYEKVQKVQMLTDDLKFVRFEQERSVKGIYYNTFFYTALKIITNKETISIRLNALTKPMLDMSNERIICDVEHCRFFNNGCCKNFFDKQMTQNSDGTYEILLECFLENEAEFMNNIRMDNYQKVFRKYQPNF